MKKKGKDVFGFHKFNENEVNIVSKDLETLFAKFTVRTSRKGVSMFYVVQWVKSYIFVDKS